MILLIQHDPKVTSGTFGRALTESGIPHQTVPLYSHAPLPPATEAAGVILLGGFISTYQNSNYPFLEQSRNFIRQCLIHQTPLLALCLGGQLLSQVLGGRITSGSHSEYGPAPVSLTSDGLHDPLFVGVTSPFPTFQWHGDSFSLPEESFHLAFSEHCPQQGFRFGNAWGLQFHPEVDRDIVKAWSGRKFGEEILNDFDPMALGHLESGRKILRNFLAICDYSRTL